MLMEVCRAFHQSPDTVRGWEFTDYLGALDSLSEIPWVDKSLYNGFFKPKTEVMPLGTPGERQAFLERIEHGR